LVNGAFCVGAAGLLRFEGEVFFFVTIEVAFAFWLFLGFAVG
jgi:hypothetical protein